MKTSYIQQRYVKGIDRYQVEGSNNDQFLEIALELFQKLNENSINYCHWKSNFRLAKSLRGETDLDLLVDRNHRRMFTEQLLSLGFIPLRSDPDLHYPAIVDYLGFDLKTAKLIHLHVHYRLILGRKYIKNHHLPVEQLLLDNTIDRHGIKTPSPELELILLVIRIHLKYQMSHAFISLIKNDPNAGLTHEIIDEIEYLHNQTTSDEMNNNVIAYFPFLESSLFETFLNNLKNNSLSSWFLFRSSRKFKHALSTHQRFSNLKVIINYTRIRIKRHWLLERIIRRIWGQRKRKTPASGGLTLAVIGNDGSGKSTVVNELNSWLSWQLKVSQHYLGRNQYGVATSLIDLFYKINRSAEITLKRLLRKRATLLLPLEFLTRILKAFRVLSEDKDRLQRYLKGRRQFGQGFIVLFERFPLDHYSVLGHTMDGPKIHYVFDGQLPNLEKKLRQRENLTYNKIEPPDHIFILQVDSETAQARKPDHELEMIQEKDRALKSLVREELSVTDINGNAPLQQVLHDIKTQIWKLL
jgi:thymidylate kinase